MTGSKLIDSSIWIDYLIKGRFKEIIDAEDILKLSVLSLFEIKRKLIRNTAISSEKVMENVSFVKRKSIILSPDINIAEKAAEISAEKNIPAIDALIYATALLNNIELITSDNTFRGLKGAVVLET